ncbi:MAG: prolyl-tRNA synthetase [Candidatus Vogelbacteria bacterium RIFOXYD1_FULL_44_32]|uniref:Proline--tRNA ligase n=1 Tax=Candidatus Vogelbacteria bacterium RIFOXYD1_FULL_44_32 TaxID=1802438 RepID=A0A1G2QDM5_9BACT|nr:MAG: prolyl-tRNA synthetase [Candidatus Vogelbacteria bacterium RIFOXYD1_FULL_44_32]
MRQTKLFTKTRREDPADEVAKNAKLLIRAGYIHKEMAGVYSFLPLGLRVLEKIKNIIREEVNAIGGQEIMLTALQDKELWEKTDRWDDIKVDNWFKTKLKNGSEVGLGITHEEPLTQIMKDHISSYRDLPVYAYQFQTKFRNELRAKAGIMRGREFLMKDLYSFSATEADHQNFYAQARSAYVKIFQRVGLGDETHITFASGGIFSKFSEEFQTESEAGEDTIYLDEQKKVAINKEVLSDEVVAELGLDRKSLVEKRSIEVGNIFHLGTKFSEALGLVYQDEAGKSMPVIMGCYGLGPSRLMGTIVEIYADDGGLVWPLAIAPFQIHLVALGNTPAVITGADNLYEDLTKQGVEVLYDDRGLSAGEKLADADLLGLPYRVIVSDKTIASGQFEVKNRRSGETSFAGATEIIALIK